MERIRSRAQRIRASISAQSAGLYANMDGQWWRHSYAKAVAGFILCTILVVVPLSVALGNCKTGPCTSEPCTPASGTTAGPTPEIPCGTRVPVGPRVINGDEASPHAFPYMALIRAGQSPWRMGNGVLIHKYFVLTDSDVRPFEAVVLGAHNRSDTSEVTQKFVIDAVFKHPNSANLTWGGMRLARLAKLDRPANFSMYINRVCLPKQHFIPAAGSCKIVGWGDTNYTGGHNGLLHEGSARIISNDQCKRDMPPYYHKYITDATFCTAADGVHPDSYDMGSPLLCEQEKGVYGVLFYPGDSSRPSLFYNVTMMFPWMDELFSQYNAE